MGGSRGNVQKTGHGCAEVIADRQCPRLRARPQKEIAGHGWRGPRQQVLVAGIEARPALFRTRVVVCGGAGIGSLRHFHQFHLPVAAAMEHEQFATRIAEDQQVTVAEFGFLHGFLHGHRPQRKGIAAL